MQTDRTSLTRRKILDAARDEFAQQGIAGARVDRIAARSTVNKQRIYANFGSKEGLFAAAITDAYAHLSHHVPVPENLDEARRYVEKIFDFHSGDSRLARMIAWEGLYFGGGDFPDCDDRRAFYAGKCSKLATALGCPDPDDAAHLVLTLIAIATWPFVAEQQCALLSAPGEDGLRALRTSLSAYGQVIIDHAASTAGSPAGAETVAEGGAQGVTDGQPVPQDAAQAPPGPPN